MQLDSNKLKMLAEVDDSRFSAMLYTAAIAAGLPPEQAKAASANAPAIKKMLRNASKEDLAMLQKKLQSSPSDLIGQLGGADRE